MPHLSPEDFSKTLHSTVIKRSPVPFTHSIHVQGGAGSYYDNRWWSNGGWIDWIALWTNERATIIIIIICINHVFPLTLWSWWWSQVIIKSLYKWILWLCVNFVTPLNNKKWSIPFIVIVLWLWLLLHSCCFCYAPCSHGTTTKYICLCLMNNQKGLIFLITNTCYFLLFNILFILYFIINIRLYCMHDLVKKIFQINSKCSKRNTWICE